MDRRLRLIEFDDGFIGLAGTAAAPLLERPISELFPTLEAPLLAVLASGQPRHGVPLAPQAGQQYVARLAPLFSSRQTIVGVELTVEAASFPAEPVAPTSPRQPPSVQEVLDGLFAFAGVLLPDGTLIEANRTALDAAGLQPADVLGRPFADTYWWAYDPGVQAQLRDAITRATAGETVRYEVSVRLGADHFVSVDFMLAPVRSRYGLVQYLIPSAIDISERKRAEAALRTSEQHLSLALSAVQMGTWEFDLHSLMVRRSLSTDRLFGLEPSAEPRPVDVYMQRIHPDDAARVQEAINHTVETGAEHAVEYRVVWPDGSIHWLSSRGVLIADEAGAPHGMIGALIDITDRRSAEAALQAGEERFQVIFEHAPVGIAHVTLDGHWLRANRRLAEILGYTLEELSAHTFQELTHADDLATDLAQVERLLAGAAASYRLEKRYVRKDASLVWADLTVALVRSQDGLPAYFIAVVEDISQRKAAAEEQRFQAQLLDAVGQGIIATTFDGTVRFWNRFAEQLYGWRRDEALGRNILDLVAADISFQQGEAIIAQLQAGLDWAGTYFVRRRDGSTFPAFVTDTPLYAPDGAVIGIVGISSDITAQLRLAAEREELFLRERQSRLEADQALALLDTLLTTAPTGLCFLSPDYRYLRINEALAAMNGMPAAEHIGRSVREVLPDLAPTVEPLFDHVLTSGEPLVDLEIVEERGFTSGERRIWQASYYPVRLPDGTVAGLGIVANDITAFRAAADALRLSEERFRVALKHSPILVYTTDRELRYTWIYNQHPAFAETNLIGRRDEELLPPAEAAKLMAVKQRVLERELGERVEVQLVVSDQSLFYDLTVEPLRDTTGAVLGLTVAAIDITDLRQVEAALREAVEARDTFIAIASHDLRSPITALLGQAELFERRSAQLGLPDRVMRSAHAIVAQARRLNRMLGALLDLSRIQSGQLTIEPAPLNLAQLVARCVEETEPTLKNHRLDLIGAGDELWVFGDEVRLEQVVLNLLGNAVKYSPYGGTITVRLERKRDQACFAVADQGIGIPAEALPHLFERFYRAANAGASGISGLGIGLYAVHEILTLHRGTITVRSTEGYGSTFTACLPLAPKPLDATPSAELRPAG